MSEDHRPQSYVYTERGGWYVYLTCDEVYAMLHRGDEFLDLAATTWEGHDHRVVVRSEAVLSVSAVTEERWVFELQAAMNAKAAQDAQMEMAIKQARMAGAITREVER